MSDETEALETPQVEQAEEKPVTEARVASSEPTTPDTVHVSVLAEKKKSVPRARRMKLSLTQIDPWSVTKVSFMLLIAVA